MADQPEQNYSNQDNSE